MKRFFLIDKENVGNRFVHGICELTSEDTVVLFHYLKAPPVGDGIMNIIKSSRANLEIVEMNTHTKNAMDFQICTYLGFLVNEYGTRANYYIVSEDSGYDASIEFIKSQINKDVCIKKIRTCSISGKRSNIIPLAIGRSYSSDTVKVIKMGLKNTSSSKDFHIYLQRALKEDGPIIYNLIKPIYKEVKAEVAI